MRKTMIVIGICFALVCAWTFSAHAEEAASDPHQKMRCTACHTKRPVQGAVADFKAGDHSAFCATCHELGGSAVKSSSISLAATAAVKAHSGGAPIPETMKQHMIQWLASHNYPAYGDPLVPWTLTCNSCHLMHGAPYPRMLRYNMENGGLCVFCHGGAVNIDSNWQLTTSRRVQFAPSNLGLRLADGTEITAPASPGDNDVVSGVVNFPLTVFTGVHRTTADIAYRISIPGSVFNVRDVNPANHLYWSYDADMVTWDTRLEANNRPFTVTITPYDPVTLVEGPPVRFYVLVKN